MDANQTSSTQELMNMGMGTSDSQLMALIFMLFVIMLITAGIYIFGKKVINMVLLERKKKKVLTKIKALQMEDGKDFKFVVHSSDDDGIPSLIETKDAWTFM